MLKGFIIIMGVLAVYMLSGTMSGTRQCSKISYDHECEMAARKDKGDRESEAATINGILSARK